jgi:hypothetical protein
MEQGDNNTSRSLYYVLYGIFIYYVFYLYCVLVHPGERLCCAAPLGPPRYSLHVLIDLRSALV